MTELEELRFLNSILLEELPHCQRDAEGFSPDAASQRRLLRALMNVRPPKKLRTDFITVQDRLLQREVRKKGIVDIATLPTLKESALYTGKHASQLILWQGDITRLNADAIVNAANSALLGCFCPGHRCIDNEIHSAAGLQLRNACAQLMLAQGHDEPTGQARLTPPSTCPAAMYSTPSGPSSRPSTAGPLPQKPHSSPPATAPAWSWPLKTICTPSPFAAYPPANSIFPMNKPRK